MLIEVEGLTRRFGRTNAVGGVSFSFRAGQVVAFVGPNGAGKTTTMRIMATLDTPDQGSVRIDGVSVIEQPERARRLLGYMPDDLPAHRDMLVWEYLDFFARAFGLRGAHRRTVLDELESFTGITPIREKPLRGLSKGMKQRVSLARALVHDPPLLILDEPAAALDPRARIELRELIVALAQRGKAVFISSHILNELQEMVDSAVIIERGRLVYAGKLADLENAPPAGTPGGAGASPRVTRRVMIRVLGDAGAALRMCLEQPGVIDAQAMGQCIGLEHEGGDEACAAVVSGLVQGGARVAEVRPARTSLEQLFMDMTRGDVQ